MRKPRGHHVPRLEVSSIRRAATFLRDFVGNPSGWLDVVGVLEFQLRGLGIEPDICDYQELGNTEALAYPNGERIKVREDVYDQACLGIGRARFTLAHEFGHMFLHKDVSLARSNIQVWHWEEDSEWQADTYAAELLMPVPGVVKCTSPREVQMTFGVSARAAEIRWDNLRREGKL